MKNKFNPQDYSNSSTADVMQVLDGNPDLVNYLVKYLNIGIIKSPADFKKHIGKWLVDNWDASFSQILFLQSKDINWDEVKQNLLLTENKKSKIKKLVREGLNDNISKWSDKIKQETEPYVNKYETKDFLVKVGWLDERKFIPIEGYDKYFSNLIDAEHYQVNIFYLPELRKYQIYMIAKLFKLGEDGKTYKYISRQTW
jgi:hypothetical protein